MSIYDGHTIMLHLTLFCNIWRHQKATKGNNNTESYHHFQFVSGEEWQHRHRYDLSHTFSYPAHLVVKLVQPETSPTHTVHANDECKVWIYQLVKFWILQAHSCAFHWTWLDITEGQSFWTVTSTVWHHCGISAIMAQSTKHQDLLIYANMSF